MNFKFDGDRLFFTSDTHFNHTNILQYCNRPFKTVGQMIDHLNGRIYLILGKSIAEEPGVLFKTLIVYLEAETSEILDKKYRSRASVAFAKSVNLPDA